MPSLARRSRSRHGPPLLPAASLEGLEQFVHPYQTWPPTSDQMESWKYKPLPELPRKSSSEYSRSVVNLEPNSRNGSFGYTLSELSLTKRPSVTTVDGSLRRTNHESYGSTSPRRRAPMHNMRELYQQTSVDAQGRWIIRQSSSPALLRSRPWAETASFRDTEGSWVPDGDTSVRRDTSASRYHYTGCTSLLDIPSLVPPSTPKTVDSIDMSLIPPPLGFDMTQGEEISGEKTRKIRNKSPLLIVENLDSDICLCHSPHPRHSRVTSVTRLPSVAHRDLPSEKGTRPRESLANGVPGGDGARNTILDSRKPSEHNRTLRPIDKGQQNEVPNRTRLYSFSTSASTSMLVTETCTAQDVNTPITERHDAPYPSPRLSRSSSLPSLPPRPCSPPRTKQLAIPPTDYQKYGPEVWSKRKSKRKSKSRSKLNLKDKEKDSKNSHRHGIASYLRRLLPKTFSSCTTSALPPPPPPRLASPFPPLSNPQKPPSKRSTPSFRQPFSAPSTAPYSRSHKSNSHHCHTNLTPISPSFSLSSQPYSQSLSKHRSHPNQPTSSNTPNPNPSRAATPIPPTTPTKRSWRTNSCASRDNKWGLSSGRLERVMETHTGSTDADNATDAGGNDKHRKDRSRADNSLKEHSAKNHKHRSKTSEATTKTTPSPPQKNFDEKAVRIGSGAVRMKDENGVYWL